MEANAWRFSGELIIAKNWRSLLFVVIRGFAIVYLVSDKHNRQYALKRQFINDDSKQVDACRREYQIVSSLKGHKNIVSYVDHILFKNKSGIYDYMLLTAYYKTSVLQLMNDRLLLGQSFRSSEVLSIFCDMCEAVARLHHSVSPIIHRDLKIENILVDERNRAGPPIYVLCDFGSATTKVLSSSQYPISFLQNEVEKYTTLSYRSPEMIDLYSGKPIGTKADIWAMGVMLYKLCYFSLPFGESAMAIQNGAFSFPTEPQHSDSLKAIIKCLLNVDADKRPSIYQCSVLAFAAADKVSPVRNIKGCHKPSLSDVLRAFKTDNVYSFDGEPATLREVQTNSVEDRVDPDPIISLSPIKPTNDPTSLTTSVQPRLRPKPISTTPVLSLVLSDRKASTSDITSLQSESARNSSEAENVPYRGAKSNPNEGTHNSVMASDLGFTDLETALSSAKESIGVNPTNVVSNPNPFIQLQMNRSECGGSTMEASSSSSTSLISKDKSAVPSYQTHRRNTSDTSHIIRSAFKPYSQWKGPSSLSCNQTSISSSDLDNVSSDTHETWNPFLTAPFGSNQAMDDSHFGKCFDELPRKLGKETESNLLNRSGDFDTSSIDSANPFGAAPFTPFRTSVNSEEDAENKPHNRDDVDSVGSASDLQGKALEEDSEHDEQRMVARRRYSYEHIDGVGDDASSDSRGRTDHDSTDDISKNEESSYDEFKDDCESSQHTDVVGLASDDDCAGSRPLLEDDGLDDGEDEVFSGASLSEQQSRFSGAVKSLFIDPNPVPVTSGRLTNPFLTSTSDETPKISPVLPSKTSAADWKENEKITSGHYHTMLVETSAPLRNNPSCYEFAPATLPRQSTPLTAAPRVMFKSSMPAEALIPAVPQHPSVASVIPSNQFHQNPAVAPSIAPFAQAPVVPIRDFVVQSQDREPLSSSKTVCENVVNIHEPTSLRVTKGASPSFIEGPKTPKFKKSKDKEKKRIDIPFSGSEVETDGSEAEMCTSTSSDKTTTSKKKKKSFVLLGSNPAVAPLDLKISSATGATLLKKSSAKKSSLTSSSSRKGSSGVLNASFVNSSFLPEDLDSPSVQHFVHL
ncbi:hypothetical protein KIN20_027196 [Parelaphostrongylus tenuis]|uniref:non-specific serine/threonine protein kinase n=1 Tax=Parelaphostrongylus tenuis TaxID=148309 RepID=A0AAD5WDU7_PARTN|nr:hypothetical protein KIN20_027196 [Parelaphostrongylus tenuis]